MKSFFFYLLTILVLTSPSTVFAKGFEAPSKGKAVVYFTRVTQWGGAYSFEFFKQDQYIGMFKKKNYLRHECEPGKQLFWASSENKEFVTADLVAGESYIVIVDVIMGGWKPRVGLNPISAQDTEIFERAKELIADKNPIIQTEDVLKKKNEKLSPFISEKLLMYNNIWKEEKNFKHISSDMALPADAMK